MSQVNDRLKELKTALQTKVSENDEIIKSVNVDEAGDGSGNIVVTPEQQDAFRKNLADANEIKGQITLLEGQDDLHNFLDSSGDVSLATKAAAAGYFNQPQVRKTLGAAFVESDQYKDFRKAGGWTMHEAWEIDGIDLGSAFVPRGTVSSQNRKDIWTGGDGTGTFTGVGVDANFPFGINAMGAVQVDPLVPLPQRTVRVRDLFPVQQTNAAVIEYFRVTGFTNNASVVPDRDPGNLYGMKPHSGLTFTGQVAPVRTIAHWETIHRNALDDVAQLASTVNTELLYGLRLAEDAQILNGTGVGDDLQGILTTPGIHTLTRAIGDNDIDAIRRSMTQVYLSYYEPTGLVVHPLDWESMELAKSSIGTYLLTQNLAIGAVKQVWRLPVVDTPAIAQNTALVGAFGLGAQLYDRQVGNIRIAEQHADLFIRNAVLVLAEERIALAVKRPESFVKVNL